MYSFDEVYDFSRINHLKLATPFKSTCRSINADRFKELKPRLLTYIRKRSSSRRDVCFPGSMGKEVELDSAKKIRVNGFIKAASTTPTYWGLGVITL